VNPPSIRTENLTIRFGGHAAVNDVTCAFFPGELTVIVGPNGAGKTTWFNLVSGQLKPTEGHIFKGETEITRMSAVLCHKRDSSGMLANLANRCTDLYFPVGVCSIPSVVVPNVLAHASKCCNFFSSNSGSCRYRIMVHCSATVLAMGVPVAKTTPRPAPFF